MASWKKAYPSNYLKKEDLEGDFVGTIIKVGPEEVGNEDDRETKLVIHFKEPPKGCTVSAMVCNKTNCQIIEEVLGTDDIDVWVGKQIVIFNNPKVAFGGKKVGGISVRETKPNADPFASSTPVAHPEFADSDGLLTKTHYRLAALYNGILKTNPAAAAQFPGKFFVVNGKALNWDTVLKLKSDAGIAWMEGTLIPAVEAYVKSSAGPALDISEDDIPF